MLYLNSIENAEASPTDRKYAICHEEVPLMPNIPELAPSRELLAQWQSNTIDWEEFRKRFTDEMRAAYRKEESRLKGLIKYSLENDVTLHSPEPSGEQTYRAILEGIINVICKSQGRTGHVINLASEPIEDSQPQEDIASLFGDTLHELNLTKGDNTRLLIENAELKRDIQSFQTESHNKGKENDELKKRIDQLEEKINTHEATTDDLHQTLSEKDGEIQSLNNAIGERDSENDRLNRTNGQLQQQINTHETTIGDLRRTLSEKDGEIQSLNDAISKRDRESEELNKKIDKLQDINKHPGIKDIALKATRDNPVVFDTDFSTLVIDSNLPIPLRTWLEKALKINQNSQSDLYHLIREHTDFKAQYTLDGKFDKYDVPLADVIRMQRNLIAHPEMMDERTKMARVYCCFFAAALLAPKLSKSDQTSTAPKNTHRKQQHQRPSQSDYTSTKPPKLIKLKSHNAEAHYDRGVIYRQNGDCERAIAEYTKAIELKPNYAEAYRSRGTAYYHKGDYNRAIAEYTKAIELRPNYAEVYYDRGTAYYRKGDYNRAIAEYTKAIELKPNYVKAYRSREVAYKKKANHAPASADFDKVKQLQK